MWHELHGCVLELVVAYLVVADEGIGRQVPFTFLDRVKEDFKKRYQEGKTDLAVAYSLDQEFGCDSKKKQCCCCFWSCRCGRTSSKFNNSFVGYFGWCISYPLSVCMIFLISILGILGVNCRPRLKEQMEYCIQHPDEMNKVAKIKSQVAEVKDIMMENIERVCFYLTSNAGLQGLLLDGCR